jgi:hypothetical protein
MIDRNKPENQTDGEKPGGGGEPDAADEILIVDYVMLDFVDEPFAPWENDRRGTMKEPWHHG